MKSVIKLVVIKYKSESSNIISSALLNINLSYNEVGKYENVKNN